MQLHYRLGTEVLLAQNRNLIDRQHRPNLEPLAHAHVYIEYGSGKDESLDSAPRRIPSVVRAFREVYLDPVTRKHGGH